MANSLPRFDPLRPRTVRNEAIIDGRSAASAQDVFDLSGSHDKLANDVAAVISVEHPSDTSALKITFKSDGPFTAQLQAPNGKTLQHTGAGTPWWVIPANGKMQLSLQPEDGTDHISGGVVYGPLPKTSPAITPEAFPDQPPPVADESPVPAPAAPASRRHTSTHRHRRPAATS